MNNAFLPVYNLTLPCIGGKKPFIYIYIKKNMPGKSIALYLQRNIPVAWAKSAIFFRFQSNIPFAPKKKKGHSLHLRTKNIQHSPPPSPPLHGKGLALHQQRNIPFACGEKTHHFLHFQSNIPFAQGKRPFSLYLRTKNIQYTPMHGTTLYIHTDIASIR